MRSAIAILTYNRLPVLKKEMQGIYEHCSHYPVAIFDDLSQRDGTARWLKSNATSEFEVRDDLMADEHASKFVPGTPGIKVFLGNRNLGVAGNTNRALKWFMDETDADHLCLLNDDLIVSGDFVEWYAKAHEDLGVGMMSFCDFTHHPSYRWIDVRKLGYIVKICPRMTAIMTSMTRKVVETIGYYDPKFGMFGQEHCTTGDTLVWMGDYTFKPISKVKVGDVVMGWKKRDGHVERPDAKHKAEWTTRELVRTVVEKASSHRAEVVRVSFESGASVTCTEDHLWALYRDHHVDRYGNPVKFGTPSIGRTMTKVVTPQVWDSVSDVDYCRGYVKGALDGDGSYRDNEVVLRVQSHEFTSRFRACLDKLGVAYTETYYEPDNILITRITGGKATRTEWEGYEPHCESSWRGWLGGMYDAEGSGRTIGQSQKVNPDICLRIYKALDMFGFDHYTQDHQVYIKGNRDEMLRFFSLSAPVCSYKMDSVMLSGRFKKPDKIVSVIHVGEDTVYGLKTSSGNYVAGGYASKNCDHMNRARMAGFMSLDGMMQPQLDVHHHLSSDPKVSLLAHQECETSVTGFERAMADRESSRVIEEVGHSYKYRYLYRPFSLVYNKYAGAHSGQGIPVEEINTAYTNVVDYWPKELPVLEDGTL